MTGQDGGFRAAAARFRAEVEAALTRARRAAAEAKEQSAEFRRGSDDLATQARTGRLRAPRRGQVRPTSPESRAEAEEFRAATGLPVQKLPAVDARPPAAPAEEPRQEDEDFSQHTVLFDIDAPDEPEPEQAPAVDQTSDQSARPGTDSPDEHAARRGAENEDFSQQRILLDATVESYRPQPLPDSVFEPSDEKKPS